MKISIKFFLIQVYFDSLGNEILLESSHGKLNKYLESHDKIQRLVYIISSNKLSQTLDWFSSQLEWYS